MSDSWLQSYVAESVRRNLCTRIHCTTCGALEFRGGLLDGLALATGRPVSLPFDRGAGMAIASALREVAPVDGSARAFEEAVQCILFDLWSGVRIGVEELHSLLAGTWSGQVLRRMQAHHAAREAARRARIESDDPVNVQKRRDEKKRIRQEQHQQRLVLQRDRSRAWHESHSEPSLTPTTWDRAASRHALDELFTLAGRYRSTAAYHTLLEFVARFRFYAPFNAMLVHVQLEGATFVAPPNRWLRDYNRRIRADARPLVILQPKGPVMFVFDVSDTEPLVGAPPVPLNVERPFEARGKIGKELPRTIENARRDGVEVLAREAGSQNAGKIRTAEAGRTLRFPTTAAAGKARDVPLRYELLLNGDHTAETKYATLVHELAHLYCGHLGTPNDGWWPDRRGLPRAARELEAESVSYLVCCRAGIDSPSAEYLSAYVSTHADMPSMSLDCVMKVAGLIEQMGRDRLAPRKQ